MSPGDRAVNHSYTSFLWDLYIFISSLVVFITLSVMYCKVFKTTISKVLFWFCLWQHRRGSWSHAPWLIDEICIVPVTSVVWVCAFIDGKCETDTEEYKEVMLYKGHNTLQKYLTLISILMVFKVTKTSHISVKFSSCHNFSFYQFYVCIEENLMLW